MQTEKDMEHYMHLCPGCNSVREFYEKQLDEVVKEFFKKKSAITENWKKDYRRRRAVNSTGGS